MKQLKKHLTTMTAVLAVALFATTAFAAPRGLGGEIFDNDLAPELSPPKKRVPTPNADKLVTSPPPGAETPAATAPSPRPAPAVAGEDNHFIQPDDFFIQRHSMEDHAWIWVELAKMVTRPNAATKGEAEFMKIRDGRNYWTSHYWKTRVAVQSDLRLGQVVVCFNDNSNDDIYAAPEKKEDSRGGSWFMAKITDMSDSYKGYLTVSGNYKVALRNLRIPIRY